MGTMERHPPPLLSPPLSLVKKPLRWPQLSLGGYYGLGVGDGQSLEGSSCSTVFSLRGV